MFGLMKIVENQKNLFNLKKLIFFGIKLILIYLQLSLTLSNLTFMNQILYLKW